MKVAAYIALHYGKDYLPYVIRSIIDQVDRLIILYAEQPTYGHSIRGATRCPENKEELKQICIDEAGSKLVWKDVINIYREGDHRNQAFAYVDGFDCLAVVDADEIWKPEAFTEALQYVNDNHYRRYGVKHQGWYHFWRSFDEYCQDGFAPIRFHKLRRIREAEDINCPGTIYHMGYAQTIELMRYKWQIHGHQNELIPNWMNDKFIGYKRGETKGLHPVSFDIWQEPKPFDKSTMPEFMKQHPFYNLDKII